MALVTSPFLAAVSASTWSDAGGGCLRDPSTGTLRRPAATPSTGHDQPWSLVVVPGGYAIPHAVYAALVGATANADGTFTTANGVTYWLGVSGGAVLCETSSPPPPPPP